MWETAAQWKEYDFILLIQYRKFCHLFNKVYLEFDFLIFREFLYTIFSVYSHIAAIFWRWNKEFGFKLLAEYSKVCLVRFLNFMRFLLRFSMQFLITFHVSCRFFINNEIIPLAIFYPIIINFVLRNFLI